MARNKAKRVPSAFPVAENAAKRAITARVEGGLGGEGEYGALTTHPLERADWNRVLWATFTRVASVFFAGKGTFPETEAIRDAIGSGFIAGARETLPPDKVEDFVAEATFDCTWAPNSLPLPRGLEVRAPYLLQIMRGLGEARPFYVSTKNLVALANSVRDGQVNRKTRLSVPSVFFFQQPWLSVPQNVKNDPVWKALDSASRVILSAVPLTPATLAPARREYSTVDPRIQGVILIPDRNRNGVLQPTATYLISPSARILDGGRERRDVYFPNTLYPVTGPASGSGVTGLLLQLAASAEHVLGTQAVGYRTTEAVGLLPPPGLGGR